MPRIEHIEITPVAFREPPLLAQSGLHQPYALRTIIEMYLEGGVVGLGESYGDTAIIDLLRATAPRLIGQDVTDITRIHHETRLAARDLGEAHLAAGTRSPVMHLDLRARSGLEVAAFDAFGRITGKRICDLLGGPVRDRVPFSAYLFYKFAHHIGFEDDADDWGEIMTPEQMVEEARRMMEVFGFKSLKLKGGVFEPERDLETLDALSRAFPGVPLRIDPNCNWTVETTKRLLKHFEGKLEYLEDPCDTISGMAEVQAATDIPLATNMCVTQMEHLPEAIRLGAVRVILADHHYWGGLRTSMHLAEFCRTWDIGISMHSNSHLGISLMAMAHLGAAIDTPLHDCDTHYSWQTRDLVENGMIRFDDGAIVVPEGPGLGVEIDRATLREMADTYASAAIPYRDDPSEMRKHWPDFTPERSKY